MLSDPTKRFSSRVENYRKYRPGYPPGVLDVLRRECALTPETPVADIGSGTGIFSEVLLKGSCPVYGVEPNDEMRVAAERLLVRYPRFTSVKGTAEATTLADTSVGLITAAQAFHWFDRRRAREEFRRILQPGGWLALIWNDRQPDTTSFLREYEELLQRFGTDYLAVCHRNLDIADLSEFVAGSAVKQAVLENAQVLDYDGIRGRLLSSSYAPEAGHPNHAPMLAALRTAFDRYAEGGRLEVRYDTRIFFAQLPPV